MLGSCDTALMVVYGTVKPDGGRKKRSRLELGKKVSANGNLFIIFIWWNLVAPNETNTSRPFPSPPFPIKGTFIDSKRWGASGDFVLAARSTFVLALWNLLSATRQREREKSAKIIVKQIDVRQRREI
jgi:hypothetical protein